MKKTAGTSVMQYVGYALLFLVGLGGIAFSMSNTYSLFQSIFGTDFAGVATSIFGLTLLDIGAIAWVVFAVSSAKGIIQRLAAFGAGVVCLLLTLCAAGAEILLKQNLIERPDWIATAAISSIVIGLAVNLITFVIVHVSDPDTLEVVKDRVRKDQTRDEVNGLVDDIKDEAMQKARVYVNQIAGEIAQQLGRETKDDVVRMLLGHTPGGNNTTPIDSPWRVSSPATALGGGDVPRMSNPYRQSHGQTLDATQTFGKSDEPLPNYPTRHNPTPRGPQPPRFEAGPGARPDSVIRPFVPTWHDVPESVIKVEKYNDEFDTPIRTDPEDSGPKEKAHTMRQ